MFIHCANYLLVLIYTIFSEQLWLYLCPPVCLRASPLPGPVDQINQKENFTTQNLNLLTDHPFKCQSSTKQRYNIFLLPCLTKLCLIRHLRERLNFQNSHHTCYFQVTQWSETPISFNSHLLSTFSSLLIQSLNSPPWQNMIIFFLCFLWSSENYNAKRHYLKPRTEDWSHFSTFLLSCFYPLAFPSILFQHSFLHHASL